MSDNSSYTSSSVGKFKTILAILGRKAVKFDVDFEAVIGEGAYGKVFQCYYAKNHRIKAAVKVVRRKTLSHAEQDNMKKEILFLTLINHVNIVRFFGFGKDVANVYIFTELMETDMFTEIMNAPFGSLSERKTRFLMKQVCLAVEYLHNQDIVHCDLKPENVLLDSTLDNNPLPAVKLCDLGVARVIGKINARRSVKGTRSYMPPEVLSGNLHSRSMDIWSVGVICYVSLTGQFPFSGREVEEILWEQEKKLGDEHRLYSPILFDGVEDDAIDLLKQLLADNSIRIPIKEVLQHKWFHDYNLFVDTRSLEQRIHKRYITTREDSKYWKKWLKNYTERKHT